MKPKNKGQQIMLYVVAVGALILILVYVFVFQKLQEQAETINASNKVLRQRVDELKQYYDYRDEYLALTEEMRVEVGELLVPYPADSREEDSIMLAVQMQESYPIEYTTINIATAETVKLISYETVSAVGLEEYPNPIVFSERDSSYVNEVSYEGLKEVVQTILASDNRIGIKNISYTKNPDNGRLSGSVDLTFYSVQGTTKEYTVPDIAAYLMGTDNIFGKMAVKETVQETPNVEPEGNEEAVD